MLTSYQSALADIDGMIGIAVLLAVALALAYGPAKHLIERGRIPPGLVLVCVALAAALLGASTRALSYDEAFTAAITALPPDRIVLATAGDVHPPAYYLAVRAVRPLVGGSESALRLWSALCAGVAAWLVYRIGCRYLAPRHALAAGYVAALLPGVLAYAQTARMYSMLAALCLAAFWAALNGRWLLFVGAAGLAVYTHNYAWLYILALAPLWIIERNGRLALAAVAGAYLPWAIWGLPQQIAHVGAGFWILPVTVWRILEPALMIGTGYNAPPMMTVGLVGLFILLTGAGLWAIVTQFPAMFSTFYANWLLRTGLRWARYRVTLLTLLILPPALAALASILFRPVYLPRAFIPGVYLLPIVWLSYLRSRPGWVRGAAAVALIAAVVFYYYPASDGLDVRGLIKKASIGPGDQLYHVEIASLINMEYYAPTADHWLYPYASDLSQTLTPETQAVMGLRAAEYVDLPAPAGRRLLVVCLTPFTTPAQQAEIDRLLDRPGLVQLARQGDNLRTIAIYEVGA